MGSFGFGIGIVSIMIIFGIIVSGSFTAAINDSDNIKAYADYNILPPNFDNFLEQFDTNITLQIDTQFSGTNLSPGIKKTVHYITKGVIYGIYTDLYLGVSINEYMPGLYSWMKENMFLVIAIIIIIMFPGIITLLAYCILGIILILYEKYFSKTQIRNTWRESKEIIQEKKSLFGKLFRKK